MVTDRNILVFTIFISFGVLSFNVGYVLGLLCQHVFNEILGFRSLNSAIASSMTIFVTYTLIFITYKRKTRFPLEKKGVSNDHLTDCAENIVQKLTNDNRDSDEVKDIEEEVAMHGADECKNAEPAQDFLNEEGVDAQHEIEIDKCMIQLEFMIKKFLLSSGIDIKFCIQAHMPKIIKMHIPTSKLQQILIILITNMANSLKRMDQDTKKDKDIVGQNSDIQDIPMICLCISHSRKWIQFFVYCENHIFPYSDISNIGIDIVRRIIEKWSGEITCDSLNHFRLKIPIVCNEIPCDSMHNFSFPLVIAEEDTTIRKIMSKMLQKAGFQHVTACNTNQEFHNITHQATSPFLLISSPSILSSNQNDQANSNNQTLIQFINPQSDSNFQNGSHSHAHSIIMLKPIYIQDLMQNICTCLENSNKKD